MVKVVTFFLIGIAILALFGRLRLPRNWPKRRGLARCPDCGRPLIGKAPCNCGGKG